MFMLKAQNDRSLPSQFLGPPIWHLKLQQTKLTATLAQIGLEATLWGVLEA